MSAGTSVVPERSGSGRSIGFFGRLKTGLKLSKDSIGVIREHPKLLLFPLLGGVASVLFWVLFLVPLVVANMLGSGIEYPVLFVLYFLTTFTATFFTASLVFAVNRTFHGEEPDLRESMRAAWERKGPIFVWSVVAATVSLILKQLQEADNPVARILSSLFAVGWTVLTFFIVPVIVFEDVSVRSMFSRSGETFRATWGESIGVGMGVTAIGFVVAIVGGAIALGIGLLLAMVLPPAGLIVGGVLVAIVLVGSYLLTQTIWGITKTALYVYAAEGRVPDEFADFDFDTLDGRTGGSSPGGPGTI